MGMEVLQSAHQYIDARRELMKRGLSSVDSSWVTYLRRIGVIGGVAIGELNKSWDVLQTLRFLEGNIQKTEPILDIGCYASEILVALHRMGYSNLTGADLNPLVRDMPFQRSIRYVITDFMHTKFADASFRAITSISVIEHGFNGDALLNEVSRLLQTGGFFIASFDYWPQKIDTSGIQFFGLDWQIFSKPEVDRFIAAAAERGLVPAGQFRDEAADAPIECAGKKYTFAWLALKKTIG